MPAIRRNPDHDRGRAACVVVDGKEIKGTLVRLARAGATVRVEVIVRPEHGRL